MRLTRALAGLVTLLVMLRADIAFAAGQLTQVPTAPVPVTTTVETMFPQGMAFTATIPLPGPDANVEAAQLLYRIASDPTINLEILDPSQFATGDGQIQASAFLDFLAGFVPVGIDLAYNWEILLSDGSVVETSWETAQWRDTRFEWEMRETDQIRLYSYGASDEFAWMMANASQATVDDLESLYDIDDIPVTSIWVYESYSDFRDTLQGNGRESVAGLTYLGTDTIVAIVPDGNDPEFGRVILHEISHQVLSVATREAYAPPPFWFIEGMATHTQVGGTANFMEMVIDAYEEGTLFDIQALETNFPYQPAQASLAYATSWSVVTYIESTWGPDGIARLIDAFSHGLPADEAVQHALSVSLDELNDGWKTWVSIGAPAG